MYSVCKPRSTSQKRKFQDSFGSRPRLACSYPSAAANTSLAPAVQNCDSVYEKGHHSSMKCLFGKALSPTIYFLLAILQILQYCCTAEAGSINIAPVTQHANLSDSNYATFYCRATTSRNTLWAIDMATYASRNYTRNGYIFREVIVEIQESGNIVHDMYLEVPTTAEKNGTSVQCAVLVDVLQISENVTLIVQGGPGAPVPVLRMVNSGLIILDWEAPFTWPYTDIHHYSVSVNTSMENWNHTDFIDTSLEFRPTQGHIECTVYAFTVLANNRLADGIPGTVIGGFPIVPLMQDDPILETFQITDEGKPLIHLEIKLPKVCDYQQVEYQLTLRGPDSEILLQDGPHTRSYAEGNIVIYEINNLTNVKSVYATAQFMFVNNSNVFIARKNFSISIEAPSTDAVVPSTDAVVPSTDAVVTETGLDEQVVPIAVGAGVVLLIAAVFIVVFAAVCIYYRRRGLYGTASQKNPPMVTNPIYEGQSVYETIDPHFRPISFTSSHSLPPPTPTSSRPLIESPYSHTQVDPSYASPAQLHFPSSLDDTYTVMTSASGFKMLHVSESGDESNLDNKPSDVARYAPEPSNHVSDC